MAASLIGGLVAENVAPSDISVVEPLAQRRQLLADEYGVQTGEDASQAIAGADVVLFAVKPQVLAAVAQETADAIGKQQPLVISIAAGVRTQQFARWLGGAEKPYGRLIRSMPNTPALVGAGAIGLYAAADITQADRDTAEAMLGCVGVTCWVEDEAALDALTAVSASGPAYFFKLMEALEKAGLQSGLPSEAARLLVLQTALGAARMAVESGHSPQQLREQVTSPGGTTEQAIQALNAGDFDTLVEQAVAAARRRAGELSAELDNQGTT